jgi:hypothetical protein
MKFTLKQALVVVVVAAAVGLPSAKAQIPDENPDPSTPYGRSVIQNNQYYQQQQQNQQQIQQNWQQEQQQNQQQMNQNLQYHGGQSSLQSGRGGGPSFGAIAVSPVKPYAVRGSFNFPSAASARAAAMNACQSGTHSVCKLALAFVNTCGAIAISPTGKWAAAAATLQVQAMDEALTACDGKTGRDCGVKKTYCLPVAN